MLGNLTDSWQALKRLNAAVEAENDTLLEDASVNPLPIPNKESRGRDSKTVRNSLCKYHMWN